jgi:hypothetical protein
MAGTTQSAPLPQPYLPAHLPRLLLLLLHQLRCLPLRRVTSPSRVARCTTAGPTDSAPIALIRPSRASTKPTATRTMPPRSACVVGTTRLPPVAHVASLTPAADDAGSLRIQLQTILIYLMFLTIQVLVFLQFLLL